MLKGEKIFPEKELTHLDGHKGSKPVRIGNGAIDHIQLVSITTSVRKSLHGDVSGHLRRIVRSIIIAERQLIRHYQDGLYLSRAKGTLWHCRCLQLLLRP